MVLEQAGAPVRDDGAGEPARRDRRPLWAGLTAALAGTAVLVGSLVPANVITTAYLDAHERLQAEQTVSPAERAAVEGAVAAASGVGAQIDAQRAAYGEAVEVWTGAEATIAAWREQADAPAAAVANPGGPGFPGGDGEERALLDSIGASAVQVVFEAGPENCGYSQREARAGFLFVAGCYNAAYRNSLFIAWDPGLDESDIWPVFVHEAMHWYQWDRHATLFEAASRVGVSSESFRPQIETDASCRAVYQHGVDRSEYANSSSPCDIDDWHDGWLVEQLAALGVPTAAPDAEAYEVQGVLRP